jgi:predicted Holliday junction resolvase-like endonuclease
MDPRIAASILFGVLFLAALFVFMQWLNAKREAVKYKEKYEREIHYRKSSEVRLGKIGENLAPFLAGWPWKPRRFRFLGNPVDGIQFNDDEVVFVEIKTGKARLSSVQKSVKRLVKEGKVRFVTFKVSEDGAKLIEE